MEIPKIYEPNKAEDKWYAHWMKQNYFHSEPDEREPYTIVIQPPNVTAVLHLGQMLNNTIPLPFHSLAASFVLVLLTITKPR